MAGQYRFKDQSGNIVAQISASVDGVIFFSSSQVNFSQANSINLGNVQLAGTASNALLLNGYNAQSFTLTSSIHPFTASTNSRLNSIENITSSLASTGSNTFFGTQIFSGSVYIANNLVVQGSSSLQNITASAVSIGTNTILLNTDNPAVRFSGISSIDSGSAAGKSGSLYFDSTDNEWIFVHQGNTAVTSSTMITGPETYDSVGNETHLSTNVIPKIKNDFHLYDSCIIDDGTTTCIKNNLITTGASIFSNNLTTQGTLFVQNTDYNTGTATGTSFRISLNASSGNTYTKIQTYTDGAGTYGNLILNPSGACIGIGTTSPYSTLTVGSSDATSVITPGGNNTHLTIKTLGGSGAFRVYSIGGSTGNLATTESFRIDANGRVGIGTSTPGALLAVQAASGADAFGLFMGGAGTTCGGIKMGNDSNTYASLYFDNATNDVLLFQQYNTGNLRFGTNSIEKMRITSGGCITLCNNSLPLASISQFGYSSSYQVLILGNTNNAQTKTLAFGVDVYGNNSGAFSGYGNEYIWRCAGSFITPNSANNGYNTIFNWNAGGCSWFSNPLGVGITSPTSTLHVKSVNDGFRLESACARGTGQIYFSFGDPTGRKGYLGYGSSTSDLLVLSNDMNAPVAIYTNDTKRVNIANSGEVTFCCQLCTPGISITSNPIGVEYLIIAGGGGGGWDVGGGGGAGGVLNDSIGVWPGTYNIGIGAGGPGKSGGGGVSTSQNGYNTYAIGLMAIGGGGGGNYSGGHGSSGGSGGGGAGYGATTNAGFGMKGQGFEGGCGINVSGYTSTGGGGGGAGGTGPSSINNLAGSTTGGVGIISTIIGEHRSYGCGGRGGGDNWSGPMNTGTANTGNGGDGAGVPNEGCAGGSGIVILKMKNTNSATFSGGLTTYTCTNVACYNIYVVTAGAGTVTIS